MEEIEKIIVFKTEDWTSWLKKNHVKKSKVGMICYKKHTGKSSLSHKEAMFEAICFGWIDTTLKRLDEDKYVRFFARRGDKANWSKNTLRYGKELFEAGRMSELGIKRYKEGLKKKPLDYGLPDKPNMPIELKIELEKNDVAKKNFNGFSNSLKYACYRFIMRVKGDETKSKRVKRIFDKAMNNDKRMQF